jgi:hypothetical protein
MPLPQHCLGLPSGLSEGHAAGVHDSMGGLIVGLHTFALQKGQLLCWEKNCGLFEQLPIVHVVGFC